MHSFYLFDELLATPLFQGMSRTDLQEIISDLRVGIVEHGEGIVIASADMPCDRLIIVLCGTVKVTSFSVDRSYSLTEMLNAPLQVQVESLFGRRTAYTSTFFTASKCKTIILTKRDVLKLYNNYEVFRLNLLNTLVVKLQKSEDRGWACSHLSLRQRIVQFIARHCTYPAGEKWVKITMNNLAIELNDSWRNISNELNNLRKEGLIILNRGEIHIPALETLYYKTM